MSYSSYAVAGYGIDLGFDEDEVHPWDSAVDECIENWWRGLHGWDATRWAEEDYFDRRDLFDALHPRPFRHEEYGHYDYRAQVLFVPGTVRRYNSYGPFDFRMPRGAPNSTTIAFTQFCEEHSLDTKPGWIIVTGWR